MAKMALSRRLDRDEGTEPPGVGQAALFRATDSTRLGGDGLACVRRKRAAGIIVSYVSGIWRDYADKSGTDPTSCD